MSRGSGRHGSPCLVEEGFLGEFVVVPKGLQNVVVDETRISGIDIKTGRTYYRGYDIEDIGRHASFYEAVHLFLYGELPCEEELKYIRRTIDKYRGRVPEKLFDALRYVPATHPMYYGVYGVSLLGQYYAPDWGLDRDSMYDHALRVVAQLPVVFLAAWWLSREGRLVRPDSGLSHAEDILRMIRGGDGPVGEKERRALEASLILYMDHGFNASTFTVRVIASTLSDIYSAVAGGLAALKGPLHGGANEAAMTMLLDAKRRAEAQGRSLEEYIEEYILEKLQRREKIMGFGHRLYKTKRDPRIPVLEDLIAGLPGGEQWLRVLRRAEEVMWREKRIPPNMDFYTAVLYHQLGIPVPLYTPIFAMGRVAGWVSHYIEQVGNNKLIRPSELYVGEKGLTYKPLPERCRR